MESSTTNGTGRTVLPLAERPANVNGISIVPAVVAETGQSETETDEDDPDQASHRLHQKSFRKSVADAFFESKSEALVVAASKRRAAKSSDTEGKSLKELMTEAESKRIVGSPRNYQLELFEIAKSQNTVAVLDTGSGKTLVAVLLLRHVLDQELERRAAGGKPKTAFFLVDKVALVFQQYGVLVNNMDQKVQHICGAMGPSLWTKVTWDKFLAENMVVVCTADILYFCLSHSFMNISDINLLIFDEAHHAKKKHPYAKIIKDFYVTEEDEANRPRIFGMTASPIDIEDEGDEVDIMNVVQDLETLLHSQIATPENHSELQQYQVFKPKEQVTEYDPAPHPYHTPLYSNLLADCGSSPIIQNLLAKSKDIARHLGPWCGDKFWSIAVTDEITRRRQDFLERTYASAKKHSPQALEKQIEVLQTANEVISNFDIGVPRLNDKAFSPKVQKLQFVLQRHFELPTEARCLVFVEERITARLLASVFQNLEMDNLRPDFLVGSNGNTLEGFNKSVSQQVKTLMKFRKGTLNCLFATTVAEEGLDIQDCNVVIRFDLAKTTIQYIQSRGRARRPNSIMYHLTEKGNFQHTDNLARIRQSDDAIKRLCTILPKDRLIQDVGFTIDDMMERDRQYRHYKDKISGAILNYNNSRQILANFVDHMPHDPNEPVKPVYYTTLRSGRFIAEVVLPPNAPVSSAIGKKYSTKSAARASAAFELCIQLLKSKQLTENLLPAFEKRRHELSNARIAVNSKEKNKYNMRLKPMAWEVGRGACPSRVYLSIIYLDGLWDRPVQPLGLLTRQKLPALPIFPIYKIDGTPVPVNIKILKEPIPLSEITCLLEEATQFTLTLFKDIFNKTFEYKPFEMSYWLVQLSAEAIEISRSGESINIPPLSCISRCDMTGLKYDGERIKYHPSSDNIKKFVPGSYLVDRWSGANRYFTRRIAPHLTPESPIPSDITHDKGKPARSVIDFTVSLWKRSKLQYGFNAWDLTQPVVEVEAMGHRLNVMSPPDEKEKAKAGKNKAFVCLEPLEISRLTGDVIGMGYIFPAIIHRIEDYLIAFELCQKIHIETSPALALEAITKDSDNTEDTETEQIHFQTGMGPNYERLEFLGDTFLKMATTIAAYVLRPTHEEFELHCDRMRFTSNFFLFETAVKKGFPEYVRSKSFSRRTWYPEGLLLLEGKNATKKVNGEVVLKTLQEQQIKEHHSLKTKSIADVSEALIGAAFMEKFRSGYDNSSQFDNAVIAITEVVGNTSHDMRCWSDYLSKFTPPGWLKIPPTAAQRNLAEKVEKIHDYHFKNPQILRSALMHGSVPRMMEGVPSYERLEFLGDALLDMAHVTHLFYNNPNKDPGWLTEHKMAMVSNQFCGALAAKLGLYKYMRHNSGEMSARIDTYVRELEEAEKASNGAVDYWTSIPEGPKCLADILESFVGAIFIDSGFDYAEVQRFWDQHVLPYFRDLGPYDSFASAHPIRKLHRAMDQSFGCREFSIIAKEIHSADGLESTVSAVVVVHDTVAGHGEAKTSRVAKVYAANAALEKLTGLAPLHFKQYHNCDCEQRALVEGENDIDVRSVGTAV